MSNPSDRDPDPVTASGEPPPAEASDRPEVEHATPEPEVTDPVSPDPEVTVPHSTEPVAEFESAEPTDEFESPEATSEAPPDESATRRFTAPSGFDDGATEVIKTRPDAPTEVLKVPAPRPTVELSKPAAPQAIPPSPATPPRRFRNWLGWLLLLVVVIAALAAVAVVGNEWLTRASSPKVSPEEQVRQTINEFDTAIRRGDLATLRAITCGAEQQKYANYSERDWVIISAKVIDAKEYPVVATIDQVAVNGDHGEANVTTFKAYAPQTQSTRSFDLYFRDGRWKICQGPGG